MLNFKYSQSYANQYSDVCSYESLIHILTHNNDNILAYTVDHNLTRTFPEPDNSSEAESPHAQNEILICQSLFKAHIFATYIQHIKVKHL